MNYEIMLHCFKILMLNIWALLADTRSRTFKTNVQKYEYFDPFSKLTSCFNWSGL